MNELYAEFKQYESEALAEGAIPHTYESWLAWKLRTIRREREADIRLHEDVRKSHLAFNDAGIEHSGQTIFDRVKLLIERDRGRSKLLMKTALERNRQRHALDLAVNELRGAKNYVGVMEERNIDAALNKIGEILKGESK